ncbi:MAG: ATP-binding protein [Ilumatobacter sp.]
MSQLGAVREHVARTARAANASDDIVEQLQLVVSELATNAIQYNNCGTLTVDVHADDVGWVIDVSNADGLAGMDLPALPDPSALSGRGLYIVDAIMDRVELVDVDGRLHLRCIKFAR